MNFKVEYILIPENYVRTSMKTAEFDRYISCQYEKHTEEDNEDLLIYVFNGVRYLFLDDDFVIEEQIK